MSLVLALFPGLDVLGMGFEAEGFTVVRGPDVVWSGDIRGWHPPAGKFDGVIGGPPCQTFSALANLVRAKGLEPSFGNLIPEFVRCVEEAEPAWFLMENVPGVPFDLWPRPAGYEVASFLLDHSQLDRGDGVGHEQMRTRRFWFGQRGGKVAELRRWIEFAVVELPERALTVDAGHDKLDGAEKIARRRQTVDGSDGGSPIDRHENRRKRQAVTADQRAVPVAIGGSGKVKATENAPRYSLAEMLDLQGLAKDLLDHAPFTMQGKRKLVGNAVPLPMARALAKAVRCATIGSDAGPLEQVGG